MYHTLHRVLLATAVFAVSGRAFAADVEVYYWVDADGVAHFSQWAPAEPVAGVSKQVLKDTTPAARDAGDDIYAVEDTARQMEALWAEIGLRREEQRQRQAQAEPPVVVVEQAEPAYVFPGWYDRPVQGPGPQPRPPRPIDRPPADSVLDPLE